MKLVLMVLVFFCSIGLMSGQSEYYIKGDSGSSSYVEYSNARLRGYIKRKDHVASFNLGYGWGGRGEFGFGIGLIDKEIYGNVNVGYNLYPRVKNHGIKVVSNFIVSRDQAFWEKGFMAYGKFGNNSLIVPSFSFLLNGSHRIGEARLRVAMGSGHLKIVLIPAVRQSRGNTVFSLALGLMKKNVKSELPIEL